MKPLSRENGQIVLITALAATVLIGFVGLAIDIGFWLHTRTKLQADADAMALAGALELPTALNVDTKAREWGTKNDVVSSEITSIAVNGASCRTPAPEFDYVTVKLTRTKSTFLAGILGVTEATIKTCASARTTTGADYYAIFANNTCPDTDTLKMPGSLGDIDGAVHSNCRLEISGSNNHFEGKVTYAGTYSNGGTGNTFDPAPAASSTKAFPVSYVYADFPCTFTATGGTDMDLSQGQYYMPDGITLKTGVYCQPNSTKKIGSPRQGAIGNVTLVSNGTIDIGGSNFQLTAYWNSILAYAESNSSSALNISGSGGSWTGLIVARNGRLNFSGSAGLSVSGGLIADQVSTSGSDWDLKSLQQTHGVPFIKLVQ